MIFTTYHTKRGTLCCKRCFKPFFSPKFTLVHEKQLFDMNTSICSKYSTRTFTIFSADSVVPTIWLSGRIPIKCPQIFPLRSNVAQIAYCLIKVISCILLLKMAKCPLLRDAKRGIFVVVHNLDIFLEIIW